ncbi:TATA-box-binding protein [Candidatus Bathyarchaeota archaeon]|nr:TATA-box-binding protein [Candidatus Bathyarchaeota archaeon]
MITDQLTVEDPCLLNQDYRVSVENVVASGKLEQRLDLNLISETIPGARYNPERFPGLFFNLKRPRCLLLVFNSGRIISMGTRSVRQAKRAIVNAVKQLQTAGATILSKPEIEIQNIVACADLRNRVDLEDLAVTLRRTIYEPENFPGLIYMMDEPKVTLLLFTNGKVVCAGAKSEGEVLRAVRRLHRTLQSEGLIEPAASPARKPLGGGRSEEAAQGGSPASEEPPCLLAAVSS